MERLHSKERFPGSISVSLLLTHGRSGRLLLTRHGVNKEEQETWGLIAGGVEKGENAWEAALREAWEEAKIKRGNIIFVQGRNKLEPHVALIKKEEKISLGLVFDVTYSGPKVPLEGWKITTDRSVDKVKFFSWKEILNLLENKTKIYRPEFNHPQLLRWIIREPGSPKRMKMVNNWLLLNHKNISGLTRRGKEVRYLDSNKPAVNWEYIPPYNSWFNTRGIHGLPDKTN
ncbi:NUDIX domain-containing protein, partial [Patescibacteria group bacterium]